MGEQIQKFLTNEITRLTERYMELVNNDGSSHLDRITTFNRLCEAQNIKDSITRIIYKEEKIKC